MTGPRPRLTVLFLAAGKRLSLLEAFQRAATTEDVDLHLTSVELTPFVPIAGIAQVVVGPRFGEPDAARFLLELVDQIRPDIVVPNSDSATVLLSGEMGRILAAGAMPLVSSFDLCRQMEDKVNAEEWFRREGLPIPPSDGETLIAKPRRGFSSRGQFIGSPSEVAEFLARRSRDDYIVQQYVLGQEYTVDAYVDFGGTLVAALSRKRLEVQAGEVDVSETHRHEGILELTERVLSRPGWLGPITLQFIDSSPTPVLIEVNPRFGGGATHSIHCGLDMPRWILRERLARGPLAVPKWPDGSVMVRARRDVFF